MSPRARRPALVSLSAGAVATLLAWRVLGLRVDALGVPINYRGDALGLLALIKTLAEQGWFIHNPDLGLPGALDLHGFPTADNAHFALLGLLTALGASPPAAFNLYFLMGFFLAAATATWALLALALDAPLALLGGLAFSVTPYHFLRGVTDVAAHLFLASYYLVPVATLLILRSAEAVAEASPDAPEPPSADRRALCLCALLPAFGIYYAAFFVVLLATLTGLEVALHRRPRGLLPAAQMAVVTVVSGALNMWPTRGSSGSGVADAIVRDPGDVERYGLKLAQLLLPPAGHPFALFSEIGVRYHATAMVVTENETDALGTLGALCLLLTLGIALAAGLAPAAASEAPSARARRLAVLTLVALLFGTVGGLSSALAYAVGTPLLRSVNRIVVYILFASLAAALLCLQEWLARRRRWGRQRAGWAVAGVGLAVLIGEHQNPSFRPQAEAVANAWAGDAAFVHSLEAELPPGSKVFELPYMAFPESGWDREDYELLRPYLHSRSLRWSFGALRGSPVDAWQRQVTSLLAQGRTPFLAALAEGGFRGVLLHRRFSAQHLPAVAELLERALGEPGRVSPDGTWAYYPLPPPGP
ncbi:MAG TPA: hypothetical protein VFH51_02865 [Myxococcota bacterium]|nr:hypothetical protein [Myxococcota bacterium]